MNVVVNNGFCQKMFNTRIEQAKLNASHLAELFERLATLKEDCVGMKTSIGGRSFVIVREGDTFILVDENDH